jgi:hypothetical protein
MKRRILALLLILVMVLAGCQKAEHPHVQPQETPAAQTQDAAERPAETQNGNDGEEESRPSEAKEDAAALPEHLEQSGDSDTDEAELPEDGEYTSKEDVARYLYLYGHLPDNFITKKEAKKLGWVSSEGNLGKVAPGKSIGGDYFGNYEGNLPEAQGREYHECDIDSDGTYRGAKRIVFSNDGLIFYTEDHYEHFELLYGEE